MPKKPKRGRKFIPAISNRRLVVVIAPVLLTALISIVIAYHFTPPDTMTMSTGFAGGTYAIFGERYKKLLAREKVRLELVSSSGSVENLKRLGDRSLQVDAGFVQDGTSSPSESKNLVSLGAICYSPLWVFYQSEEAWDDLSRLRGKKIAIGPEGSGVRKLSMDLLKASGAAEPPTILLDIPSGAANRALLEGALDVVMIIGTEDNALVRELLFSKKVRLMSFRHAEAYTRLFPALSHIVLPEGLLNLPEKKPAQDIHLVATTTSLIVRDSLHPALQYLILDAAMEIHNRAGWLNRRGEFPSPRELDIPLSTFAERFYKKGRPFLLDYLPFWVAVLVDRLILILVPVAIVLIPLLRSIPWLYSWRSRRKIYHGFEELKHLESDAMKDTEPEKGLEYRERLDQIEASINQIRVPHHFFGEVYRLKEYVDSIREKLSRSNLPSKEKH